MNIYFIDKNDANRKNACIKTLPEQIFQQVDNLTDAKIIFAHCSDLAGYNGGMGTKFAEVEIYLSKLIIVYHGSSHDVPLSEEDLRSGRLLRIGKVLPRANEIVTTDYITNSEWRKIYSLIDEKNNTFLKHTFNSEEHECLCALSILCQGYLLNALSDPDMNEPIIDSSIKDAVDLMKLEDYSRTHYQTINAHWWTDCFEPRQIHTLKMISNQKVINLLEKIAKEKKSPDLKIVAEAYLAICAILPTI
jgi:hypothetical protein